MQGKNGQFLDILGFALLSASLTLAGTGSAFAFSGHNGPAPTMIAAVDAVDGPDAVDAVGGPDAVDPPGAPEAPEAVEAPHAPEAPEAVEAPEVQ
ncbi:MAG: hypothetical protein HYX63_17725 [Gammaproteobacteria bacterium]|nr:hypothetical protein [Gammaproteobacteria bacterium]